MTTSQATKPSTGRNAPRPNRVTQHSWTEAEREYVRQNYLGTHESRNHIANHLGVSPHAVTGQIAKMGIAKRSDRRPWDEAQDERLRELGPQHAVTLIAKRMDRSVNSITVRMKRLGIHRRDRFGWYTLREACEILGKEHKWLEKRLDNGVIKATRHTLPDEKNPAARDRYTWHITEAALRDFIRRFPQDLDGRNVDLITMVDLFAGLPAPEFTKGEPSPHLMSTINVIAKALTLTQENRLQWRPTRQPREATTVIAGYTITVHEPPNRQCTMDVMLGKQHIESLTVSQAASQGTKLAELANLAVRQAMDTNRHMTLLQKELAAISGPNADDVSEPAPLAQTA